MPKINPVKRLQLSDYAPGDKVRHNVHFQKLLLPKETAHVRKWTCWNLFWTCVTPQVRRAASPMPFCARVGRAALLCGAFSLGRIPTTAATCPQLWPCSVAFVDFSAFPQAVRCPDSQESFPNVLANPHHAGQRVHQAGCCRNSKRRQAAGFMQTFPLQFMCDMKRSVPFT